MTDFAIGSSKWPGLSKLVEECGEVAQVIGKIVGTGDATNHWDGTDLKKRLEEEMGDLLAALRFVGERNNLDRGEIELRAHEKLRTFNEWHENQVPLP